MKRVRHRADRPRPPHPAWRRWSAATLGGLLAASLFHVPALAVSADPDKRRPKTQETKPVAVTAASFAPRTAPAMPKWDPDVRWPEPATKEIDLRAARTDGVAAVVGSLPVRVAVPAGARAGTGDVPAKVRVEVLDDAAAERAGVFGLALRVTRADGARGPARVALEVDLSAFAFGIGGNWASRARLMAVPVCDDAADCPNTEALETTVDYGAHKVRADIPVEEPTDGDGGTTRVIGVLGAPSGPGGTYQATSLSPAGSWQMSGNSGGFAWSYPLRMPPALAGPTPELSLQYNSGTVDGRTSSANAQPSQIGEGFELAGTGYIERSYRSCRDDGHDEKGKEKFDLCWPGKGDHLTMSFGGRNGELVRVNDDEWRLKADDGTRIQRQRSPGNDDDDGERFVVTTTDGMRHHFGRRKDSALNVPVFGDDEGEPCHGKGDEFKERHCTQAWRWLLDYTVDLHGNSMSYFYQKETNKYGAARDDKKVLEYDRASILDRIEYGQRAGSESENPAPMKVTFEYKERCIPITSPYVIKCRWDELSKDTAGRAWPDVPADLWCLPKAGENRPKCKGQWAPAFFTRKKLTKIVTSVDDGTGSKDVDVWDLAHDFPNGGDTPSLWLRSITHTGVATNGHEKPVELPATVFHGGPALPNRAVDGKEPPFNKFRLQEVHTESGGVLGVHYETDKTCATAPPAPATNDKLCIPSWWRKDKEGHALDWFYKYVVTKVAEDSRTSMAQDGKETHYEYGKPAWRYDDSELTKGAQKTWSQFRGFDRIVTRTGHPEHPQRQHAEALFLQGIDGDLATSDPDGRTKSVVRETSNKVKVTDHDRLQGFILEQRTFDERGRRVSATIHTPWLSAPTAKEGRDEARLMQPGSTWSATALDGGATRWTGITHEYDAHGMVDHSHDKGDLGSDGQNEGAAAADDSCTRYEYHRNPAKNLLTLVRRVRTEKGSCTTQRLAANTVVSDVYTHYKLDDSGLPETGDVAESRELTSFSTTRAIYRTVSKSTYDAYGRVHTSTDAAGKTTTTSYTHVKPGGVVVGMSVTDPLGHTTTSRVDPRFGEVTDITDPNGAKTALRYDALGRLVKVWQPGRAHDKQPSQSFEYHMRNHAPSVVVSKRLLPGNSEAYEARYQLHDALLRPIQEQAPAPNGGRIITRTHYDSRGLAVRRVGPFYNDKAPGTDLVDIAKGVGVPAENTTSYDAVGRAVSERFRTPQHNWETVTEHHGDHVVVKPPAGATPTATYTNAQGLPTKLLAFHTGDTRNHEKADVTTYDYDHADRLEKVVDPDGHTWSFDYDVRGNQILAVDPDTGTTKSTYDEFDRVRTVTDAKGTVLTHHYDDLGRPKAVTEGNTTLREWSYDNAEAGAFGKGRVHKATRYVGGHAYTTEVLKYDAGGRPRTTKVIIPEKAEGKLGGEYITTQEYEEDGSPRAVTLPAVGTPGAGGLAEETLRFGYSALGLPESVDTRYGGELQSYVASTVYAKLGQPLQYSLANRAGGSPYAWSTFEYEEGTQRLRRMSVDRQSNPKSDSTTGYAYDAVGNVLKITEEVAEAGTEAQCFQYDYLRRLTEAWTESDTECADKPSAEVLGGPAPYWQTFGYDAAGNRTRQVDHAAGGGKETTKVFTPFGPQRMPAHGIDKAETTVSTPGSRATTRDEYAYDAVGRMIRRKVGDAVDQKIDWDAEGQVSKITHKDGKVTSFVYDADGNRLIKRDESDQSATLYLGSQELRLDLRDPAKQTVAATRYYTHNGQTVAVRNAAGVSWLMGGQNGTSEFSINSRTQELTRQRTKPFGEVRGADTPLPGSRGFVGGTVDRSLQLMHLGAREYDPATGRFISPDPIMDFGDPQQLNAYGYGRNNPLAFPDPSGMWWNWNKVGHTVLDVVGFIPGPVGMVANGINAGWYVAQGDYANAAMSAAGMIPGGKLLAKGVGGLRNTTNAAETAKTVVKAADNAGGAAKAAKKLTPPAAAKPKPAPKPEPPARAKQSPAAAKKGDGGGAAGGGKSAGAGKSSAPKRGADAEGKPDSVRVESGGSCATHSFAPDTKVLVVGADGKVAAKAIGEVELGQKVLATDPETGETSPRSVTALFENLDEALTNVTVRAAGATEVIDTTENHPFWSETRREWVPAGQLKEGEKLRSEDGSTVEVAGVRNHRGARLMNDLTVDAVHTYHVLAGNTPILVHNCDDDLVDAVNGAYDDIVANQSIKQRGPVVSGVKDRLTGEISIAQNSGSIPNGLHPELAGRLMMIGRGAPFKGVPGSHGEIHALNGLLWNREAAGMGTVIDDSFAFFSRRLRGSQQGAQILRCGNCRNLTWGGAE